MDKCLVPCGCDSRETVTNADLDRFTDKVENVLNNEKGKKLFRNFMRTCRMREGWKVKEGCRKLDLLEDIDNIINKMVDNEHEALKSLLNKAERVEELDFAVMERLFTALSSETREDITDALLGLKTETIKALSTEYNAFRKQYTPKK